ncbi:methyltransferase domain-containing protein [Streptomyces sp. NPDC051362]|uniref:methyltransferase domain-containing protein n=1 Tax=Streptomyces sp. NPDC051362 TaxID=3365651 RepID=UPI0037927943
MGDDLSSADNAFAELDKMTESQQRRIIAYLDTVAAHPEMQRARSLALQVFAPAEGERLLDAGCGAGEVAQQLGARVGNEGHVSAIDRSERAVSVARARGENSRVVYEVGDVGALNFPDSHFDGVRCERVLQHVSDPDAVITELIRVTRPGGRVCLIDTDWTSSKAYGFDHLDEVLATIFPVGNALTIGRTLRTRMLGRGLREISAHPATLRFTSPEDASTVVPYFMREAMRDRLPTELFSRFFDLVDRSAERGDFLLSLTVWICMGRVPMG